MIFTKDVIRVNKEFGGDLVSDSSMAYAESICAHGSSKDRCMAAWIRAIIVDHPFTDGNKRTALMVVSEFKEVHDQIAVSRALIRIARQNETDLDKIAEMINNANRKGD